jgi:hypothetical protein
MAEYVDTTLPRVEIRDTPYNPDADVASDDAGRDLTLLVDSNVGEVNGGLGAYTHASEYEQFHDSSEKIQNILEVMFTTFPEFDIAGLPVVKIANLRDESASFIAGSIELDTYEGVTTSNGEALFKRKGTIGNEYSLKIDTTGTAEAQIVTTLTVYKGTDEVSVVSRAGDENLQQTITRFNSLQDFVLIVLPANTTAISALTKTDFAGGANGTPLTGSEKVNAMVAKLALDNSTGYMLAFNHDTFIIDNLPAIKGFLEKRKRNAKQTIIYDTLVTSIDTFDKVPVNNLPGLLLGRQKIFNFVSISQRFNHEADPIMSLAYSVYGHVGRKLNEKTTYNPNPWITYAEAYENNDPIDSDAYKVTAIGVTQYFLYDADRNQYAPLNSVTNYIHAKDGKDKAYSKYYAVRDYVYALNDLKLQFVIGTIGFSKARTILNNYLSTKINKYKGTLSIFSDIQTTIKQSPDNYDVVYLNAKFIAFNSLDVLIFNSELDILRPNVQ